MKLRGALYALIIFCVFLLTGCSGSEKQPAFVSEFSADFSGNFRSLRLSGTLTAGSGGMLSVNITEPDTLSGLQTDIRGGTLILRRDSLICTADEAYLPDSGFVSILQSCFDAARDMTADENGSLSLTTRLGSCEFLLDGEGKPLSLEDSSGLRLTFENVTALQP